MKKKLTLVLAVVLLLTLAPLSAFAAQELTVSLEGAGNIVFPDAKPFVNKDNRTLVPLSPVATAMDLKVAWDEAKQTASFTKEYTKENSPVTAFQADGSFLGKEVVSFTIGKKEALHTLFFYNSTDAEKKLPLEKLTYSNTIVMDTTALLQNQRTYAPVKYLAETFGYDVLWDELFNAVVILANGRDGVVVPVDVRVTGDYAVLELFQGRFYPLATALNPGKTIAKVEIAEAHIAGKAAVVNQLTEADKQLFPSIDESNGAYLSGAYIRSSFVLGNSYDVALTLRYTYSDGTSKLVPEEFQLIYQELGGK